ncbi:MAG: hypothetical protein P8Z35_12995 [Ignavibacteriaceae bacterium]
MIIPYILLFTSILIWLFPPFRQYKTQYFIFFLILALADPVMFLLLKFLSVEVTRTNLIITFFMILSLIGSDKLRKGWIFILLSLLVLLIATTKLPLKEVYQIKIILSCIVLFFILKDSLLYLNKHQTINLFYLVLILYEITIIIKFIYTASRTHTGTIYFYTTGFFEIFIGIFFCFYNMKNSPEYRLIKGQF